MSQIPKLSRLLLSICCTLGACGEAPGADVRDPAQGVEGGAAGGPMTRSPAGAGAVPLAGASGTASGVQPRPAGDAALSAAGSAASAGSPGGQGAAGADGDAGLAGADRDADSGAPPAATRQPIVHEPLRLDGCRFSNEGTARPSVEREDFQPLQGYLKPASELGIDAEYAWTVPGGTGKNVTITDIEYATWNLDHEDLRGTRLCFAQNGTGTPFDFSDDHGSGVIGVMVAGDNGFGMKGVAHDASLLTINHANSEQSFAAAIASAIEGAMSRLHPGDVILIEANTDDQRGVVEHERPVFDAIVKAVAAGIIVLETAGNGGANLDDTPSLGDSGAIFVGGGTSAKSSTPLAPMNLNYGSRIDLQGWGQNVASLGRGRLTGNFTAACNNLAEPGEVSEARAPDCSDIAYRDEFSGTSSAGPIVASAAAVISSVAQERGYLLTSQEVRELLKETGTPQGGSPARNIGPLPNLRAAIEAMPQ
ncbi:MAG: S8 family serine peptidase [Polyangiaceae bacterium]|nr:S8 family serine peptidase [Polyangiaceae bacterium]